MSIDVQMQILTDEKLHKYLRENSNWYKYLNRNDKYVENFKHFIKKKYKLGPLDKINNGLNTIDIISDLIRNV